MIAPLKRDQRIDQIFQRAEKVGFYKRSEVQRAALIHYDCEILIPLERSLGLYKEGSGYDHD